MWSLCMVSPAPQGGCGLPSHESRPGGSAHRADAILAVDLASEVVQCRFRHVLLVEAVAVAHLVQGEGNVVPLLNG